MIRNSVHTIPKKLYNEMLDSFSEKDIEYKIRREILISVISVMSIAEIDKLLGITKKDYGDYYEYKWSN